MLKKTILLTGAAFGCLLIASCGGGDGSPTPTPTPTSTATPTPTPTPTPVAVDFDFTKAFEATISNASFIYAFFTPNGGDETFNASNRRDGASEIDYKVSPESVVFDWPDTFEIPTFAAADLQSDTPTLRVYEKGSDQLRLELPYGEVLRVSFSTSQAYVRETVPGTLRSYRTTVFFNPVTTSAAINSDLLYAGDVQLAGGKPGESEAGDFTATVQDLKVATSDKKITGKIRIVDAGTGDIVALLPISAGVTASGAFTATVEDTTNKFKGNFVGSLAGPNREEVFIIFRVAHTDKREFIGSLIGKR